MYILDRDVHVKEMSKVERCSINHFSLFSWSLRASVLRGDQGCSKCPFKKLSDSHKILVKFQVQLFVKPSQIFDFLCKVKKALGSQNDYNFCELANLAAFPSVKFSVHQP